MKTLISFLLLILSFMGIIGGIGYTIYYNAWPISIGLLAAGYLAWPEFKKCFKRLTE